MNMMCVCSCCLKPGRKWGDVPQLSVKDTLCPIITLLLEVGNVQQRGKVICNHIVSPYCLLSWLSLRQHCSKANSRGIHLSQQSLVEVTLKYRWRTHMSSSGIKCCFMTISFCPGYCILLVHTDQSCEWGCNCWELGCEASVPAHQT